MHGALYLESLCRHFLTSGHPSLRARQSPRRCAPQGRVNHQEHFELLAVVETEHTNLSVQPNYRPNTGLLTWKSLHTAAHCAKSLASCSSSLMAPLTATRWISGDLRRRNRYPVESSAKAAVQEQHQENSSEKAALRKQQQSEVNRLRAAPGGQR